jgi:hypothetical protein
MKEQFADPMQFNWELLGATFIDFNVTGMTCPITINTTFFPDETSSTACWAPALDFIISYLRQVQAPTPNRFY